MLPFKDLSVVMISMNEEKAIKQVIQGINKHVPGAEIIIVDSSNDDTPIIAKSFTNVNLIRQFPPIGYGPAMTLALRSASRPIIVTMDCDNTYPAAKLPEFVSLIRQGYKIVDGCRLKSKPKNMPYLNYFANIFFARLASVLFLTNIKDLHSGMRGYSKKMLDQMTWESKPPALPVEILLKCIKNKQKFKVLFIDYFIRIGESKMDPLPSAFWTFKRIINVRFGK
jgi:glycosyltransferase involved in cell wall biosynthesis